MTPSSGQAQSILSWDLSSAAGNEASINSTAKDANLNVSALTRGSGLAAVALTAGFSSNSWDISAGSNLTTATAQNEYFQFTVNAVSGFEVSLSTLDVWFRRSGTGPNAFQWEYSLDGFSTSGTIGGNISFTSTASTGVAQTQLNLSGIADLQHVASDKTITIRLYGWGATNAGGTFAFGKPSAGTASLAIGGTTAVNSGGGPTATVSVTGVGGLTSFTTTAGTASAAQSISVSGSNLTDGIVLTPPSPYEISVDGGSSYSAAPVTLPQSGGSVAATTVDIRIAASASAGAANGTLAISSTGATAQNVSLAGTVNSTVAAPQAFTATGVTSSEIDLTATGNIAGDNILVAFNTASTFGAPSGVLTAGGSVAGGGTVLYNGPSAGFTFQHTGLNPSAIYFYKAWSVDGSNNYSSVGLTANDTTLNPPSAGVVINQVYGGGGNSGATYKNDFIELYNNDNAPVNLQGWSVQYSSSTGSSWQTTPLHGTIPAHAFFLIQEAAGTGGTANLPAPDVITGGTGNPSAIAMAAIQAKVVLANSTFAVTGSNPSGGSVVDKVGWGNANGFEGHVADSTSNTTALRRITDGVTTHDNDADFVVDVPNPRNSTYTTSPPQIAAFNPPAGTDSLPYNYAISFTFDKKIVKGSGSITLSDGTTSTPIDVNSANVVISGNTTVTLNNVTLGSGKSYSIQISAGAFQDVYGNSFAGILNSTTWTFSTFDGSTAVALPANYDLSSCTGTGLLPDGFTQYSVTGDQVWDCTPYGRNPSNPSYDSVYGHAIQINGYSNGDHLNEDWLISPKFDLSATTYPLLSFWSRSAFSGDILQLKVSTDYTGTGDPRSATWTDLNGKFPTVGSDVWTLSNFINLSDYKQSSVYVAWVYKSTTEDGSRYTLDDIQLINSVTPPPPSLTVSTTNILLGYTAAGSTVTKKMVVTGNDLTGDITLTTAGSFLLSPDSVTFSTSLTIGHDTANNKPEPVYVRFAPSVVNTQFDDSVVVAISDTSVKVSLKGNTIDPASTLSIVNWNLNWFGTPEAGFGPTDKNLQRQNVGIILPALKADIYALQEVVDSAGLDAIVATMPGYAYVLNNYGSHSNLAEANHYALNTIQKLAFVYNTAKVANIHTDSLFSIGVNTAADTATPWYNAFASGRFPYMLTADVTLSDNLGGTITKQLRLINIHAKANSGSNASDLIASYNRRKDGAHYLDSLIKGQYSADNVLLLGDFNDDLDSTITNGISPKYSSYKVFTDDSTYYSSPTKLLSEQGYHSDVNFSTSVIDNLVINKPLANWYLPNSASILTEVSELVNKYGTTTTDHYPVFSQMSFNPPVPLPVTLLNFTGVREDKRVRLNWSTAQESNSKEFQIERSSDGTHFTSIGTVAAKGNSSVKTSYVFYDEQPLSGSNFYRLRQVDLDEKAAYSKTVKVNFAQTLALRINPNPAHGTLYLSVDNAPSVESIQIVDLSGRVVKQLIPAGAVQGLAIDVNGLGKGVYTVKVVSSGSFTTAKLMIQ